MVEQCFGADDQTVGGYFFLDCFDKFYIILSTIQKETCVDTEQVCGNRAAWVVWVASLMLHEELCSELWVESTKYSHEGLWPELCGKITDREGGANVGWRRKAKLPEGAVEGLRRRFNHISTLEIGFEASGSFCSELIVPKCYSCITESSTALQSVWERLN